MKQVVLTILLLILSNIFMTFAWYGHLKNLADRPWFVAAVISWCIALPCLRCGAVNLLKNATEESDRLFFNPTKLGIRDPSLTRRVTVFNNFTASAGYYCFHFQDLERDLA
jgi:hypothetical protein